MNRHIIIMLLCALVMPLCLVSCSETNETDEEFADWQSRNETYFSNIYEKAVSDKSGSYMVLHNYSFEDSVRHNYTDYIVVEKLENGTGSGCPMFTDSVMVNYRGRLIPSTSYPEGYVFDENYSGEYNASTAKPTQLYVGNLVDGFATALQYMHIGDRWRVYVPYQLGYGTTDNDEIPAYSTLVFDIALMAYYRAGVSPTPYYIKRNTWVTE